VNGSALAFRNIRKIFPTERGPVEALRNVSLDVSINSFTAVVGPSGCGKSTLLHIATGLDTRFEGVLEVHPSASRKAYLFQTPRLLPWQTAEANVAFVREARGEAHADALAAARRYLLLVGLGGFEQHFPNHLSGGMQQRVALARALAVEPDVMVMDEPFASLDELTARRLRAELLQLYQDSPRTVLFVTHNVTEAAFLADRVVVMSPRPGMVVADIPVDLPRPRQYDDPAVALIARSIVEHLQLE
jgi:NitT/TauT family transport system ATP-binding protein